MTLNATDKDIVMRCLRARLDDYHVEKLANSGEAHVMRGLVAREREVEGLMERMRRG